MSRTTRKQGRSGVQIAEEAIHLLRETPLAVFAVYYIGSLPFVLGIIVFWAAMRQSAYAYYSLPGASLGLAALFIWMKTWQSRFCRLLLARLQGETPEPWTILRFLRTGAVQASVQTTGFFILPVALLATLPFGWVYAMYQNATVLDHGEYRSARELLRDAVAQAKLWPTQNHLILWLLSPFLLLLVAGFYLAAVPIAESLSPEFGGWIIGFYATIFSLLVMPLSPLGMAIALNICMAFLAGAGLLRSVLGIETAFTMSGGAASNSTFVAIVCGLTYLCMDPAMKAAYVVRCFYGMSLNNGEDLRIALRRASRTIAPVVLVASFLLLSTPAAAQTPAETPSAPPKAAAVDSHDLGRALDSELGKWCYTWRMPREQVKAQEEGFLVRTLRSIAESIQTAFRKLRDAFNRFVDWLFPENDHPSRSTSPKLGNLRPVLEFFLVLLIVLVLAALAFLLYRVWRDRQRLEVQLSSLGAPVLPDLEDENTAADQLPEQGWIALARELMDKGEFRLAVRAFFLAMLARLAGAELIRIARFKSNNDYAGELARHAHVQPDLLPTFLTGAATFESVWYGDHAASLDTAGAVWDCHNRLPGVKGRGPGGVTA